MKVRRHHHRGWIGLLWVWGDRRQKLYKGKLQKPFWNEQERLKGFTKQNDSHGMLLCTFHWYIYVCVAMAPMICRFCARLAWSDTITASVVSWNLLIITKGKRLFLGWLDSCWPQMGEKESCEMSQNSCFLYVTYQTFLAFFLGIKLVLQQQVGPLSYAFWQS